MDKPNRDEFLAAHSKEINDIVELIGLFKDEGYNRLKIWHEFRSNGTSGDVLLEVFRRTGLF